MKLTLTLSFDSMSELGAYLSTTGGSSVVYAEFDAAQSDVAPANLTADTRDAAGLPWDARIHSDAKTMTDKGYWRKRRGVADIVVTTIEAELRAKIGLPAIASSAPPAPSASPPPAAPPQAPPAPPAQSVAPPPSPPPAAPPQAPPAPPAQSVAPPPADPNAIDFPSLMGLMGKASELNLINAEFNQWLFGELGIADFNALATNADLRARAYALLKQHNRLPPA